MRNPNALFWREAARSLPAHVQARYAGYFERAMAWEQAFDAAIDVAARVKQAFTRQAQVA